MRRRSPRAPGRTSLWLQIFAPLVAVAVAGFVALGGITELSMNRQTAVLVQDRADRAIFAGNVQVRQAELSLSAERLTLAYSNDGKLEIEPTLDGPLAVRGNMEIMAGTGRVVARVTSARLCRCGGSANKPFCDGSHTRVGFKST